MFFRQLDQYNQRLQDKRNLRKGVKPTSSSPGITLNYASESEVLANSHQVGQGDKQKQFALLIIFDTTFMLGLYLPIPISISILVASRCQSFVIVNDAM